MYLVVIAWLYVVLMASVAEAVSSTGTVLGAIVTFVLYGMLPLGIVVYILGTPGRKRALHARALVERTAALKADSAPLASAPSATSVLSTTPDADGKTPTAAQPDAVAPVRKEP